jgi:transposase
MIRPEQVWLAVEPVDMRMGIDGLSLKIQQALGRSPCDGTAYAFRNRSGNRIKLLVWDGMGWDGRLAVCPAAAPGTLYLAPD